MAKNTALAAYKAGERARRSGRHHRPKMTISLAVAAGFAPLLIDVAQHWKNDGWLVAVNEFGHGTTGMTTAQDGTMSWEPWHAIKKFYAPLALGYVGHTVANRLGLNRMLSRAGVPFIRF